MSSTILLFAFVAAASFGSETYGRTMDPRDPAIAARDSIHIQLLFDGKPLLSKANADFSCFQASANDWFGCRIRHSSGIQHYAMARPSAGRYRLHVGLDENEDNPDSYPGDYEAIQWFDIQHDAPETLFVDMPRVIHLTSPANNGRSLEGAFSPCERDPEHIAPILTLRHVAPVDFSWDPVADGAEYRLSVVRTRCSPYERLEEVIGRQVPESSVTLELPPNNDGEHYEFSVEAFHLGRAVGVFYVHDSGTHGWDYRFRVALEKPNPRIAIVASLGAVFLFFLVSLAFMLRSGNRSLAAASLAVVMVSGWVGYQAYSTYREDHRQSRRRLLEAEQTAANLQLSLNELFVEEWTRSAPRPDWWDEVTPPDYPIDNVGELLSAWQSDFGRGETRMYRERQFFKGAYQAILDHPGDHDLTTTAIDLMAFIGRDYPHRRDMLEFAVKHFFDFERRTDDCADCMIGDRSNSFVEALASLQVRADEYEEAIGLIERFRTERRRNVSDYAWAETITVLGEAYWKSGQREKAIEVMNQEAGISGDHPYVQRLKEKLIEYRHDLEDVGTNDLQR